MGDPAEAVKGVILSAASAGCAYLFYYNNQTFKEMRQLQNDYYLHTFQHLGHVFHQEEPSAEDLENVVNCVDALAEKGGINDKSIGNLNTIANDFRVFTETDATTTETKEYIASVSDQVYGVYKHDRRASFGMEVPLNFFVALAFVITSKMAIKYFNKFFYNP